MRREAGNATRLWLLFTLIALLAGCGSGGGVPGVAQSELSSRAPQPDAGHDSVDAPGSALQDALSAIDDAQVPPGLDEELFSQLKAELKRVLEARGTRQLAVHPPERERNAVRDLRIGEQAGEGWVLSWSYENRGDYDQNGEVNIGDLTTLALHFGASGPFALASEQSVVDGDGNGEINIGDVTPIGENYLATCLAYNVYSSPNAADYPSAWDAGNGDGAQLLGVVSTGDILPPGAQRATFELQLSEPGYGARYWVRPSDSATDGTPSKPTGRHYWPMFGHDPQHTGRSSLPGPQSANLAWTFRTTGEGFEFTNSTVGPDETIYVGAGRELHALHPDGSVKWRAGYVWPFSKPVIAPDGTVYI
ncbi:MAG TPA: hypothetical protein ENO21_00635, partial [Firmicutes bacterium]|nr:hypothetical protein [Bacillota bacterium]